MRIAILAQHFFPETTPTGRRAQDLAESLASGGHRVTVITARPNHPATLRRSFCRDAAPMECFPEGYTVLRVPVFRSSNPCGRKRIATYASFMVNAAWTGMRQPRPDAIVAISPLPAGLAGLAVRWWHEAPLIFDLQDIWPDSVRAVGMMKDGFALRQLQRVERALYRRCARVVVITEGFRHYLTSLGLAQERIRVIPNGVETARFEAARPAKFAQAEPLRDHFVVGYAGNLGLAQGLDTLLEAAWQLRHEPVLFLLIGEGVEKGRLEQHSRLAGLTNVRFVRGVPRRRVPGLLAACDALLVILRDDPVFSITIPSKVYEYMAAGKPVLCSVGGECADLVTAAGCGLATRPGDGMGLADAIRQISRNTAAARAMGESGARWVRAHCDRSSVMDVYRQALEGVLKNSLRAIVAYEDVGAETSVT
jgi:glycosyltransferase involved in cell wall biosynthesis